MQFFWSDCDLLIRDPHPVVVHYLNYTQRTLDQTNRENPIKYEPIALYTQVDARHIVCFQGFWHALLALCKKDDIPHTFHDRRQPFPGPDLNRMYGFRCDQELVLTTGLVANVSGFFKLPTRYGKTTLMVNTLRAFPDLPTVIVAPGKDLLKQQVDDIRSQIPDREVRSIFSGAVGLKGQSEHITVCSVDSLDKLDYTAPRLVLIDEPHEIAAPTRFASVGKFRNARILGYGATLSGRFDRADKIITGLVGPILAQRTFPQAVAEGAICNIRVFMLKVKFRPFPCFRRDLAYNHLLFGNMALLMKVRELAMTIIPADWQTIIFIDKQSQALMTQLFVDDARVAMACMLKTTERKELFRDMVENKVKRCIASEIYGQGVTFPQLRAVINIAGGGGSITGTQKPGRLAQKQPDKENGYLIDILFEPTAKPVHEQALSQGKQKDEEWRCVVSDSQARLKVYRDNGYDVRIIDDPSEVRFDEIHGKMGQLTLL